MYVELVQLKFKFPFIQDRGLKNAFYKNAKTLILVFDHFQKSLLLIRRGGHALIAQHLARERDRTDRRFEFMRHIADEIIFDGGQLFLFVDDGDKIEERENEKADHHTGSYQQRP